MNLTQHDPTWPVGDAGRYRVTARKKNGTLWAQEQTDNLSAALDRMEFWEGRGLMVSGEDLHSNHDRSLVGSAEEAAETFPVVEPTPSTAVVRNAREDSFIPLIATRDRNHNNTVFCALLAYARMEGVSEAARDRAFAMINALHEEYDNLPE